MQKNHQSDDASVDEKYRQLCGELRRKKEKVLAEDKRLHEKVREWRGFLEVGLRVLGQEVAR